MINDHKLCLDDKEKILSLLNWMAQNQQKLELLADGEDEPIEGNIVNISVAQNAWWIAVGSGCSGRNQLVAAKTLGVAGFARKVRLEISSLAAEIDESQGRFDLLKLPLPDQAIYIQRRDCFRVPVDQVSSVPATVSSQDLTAPLQCRVIDISFEGCRLRLEDFEVSPFGDSPAQLQLDIQAENYKPVCVTGDIRHVWTNSDDYTLFVGVYFSGLNHQQQQKINQLVNDMQRKVLQQKSPSVV